MGTRTIGDPHHSPRSDEVPKGTRFSRDLHHSPRSGEVHKGTRFSRDLAPLAAERRGT